MKIIIFTPALETSAIGRMAAMVCRELLHRGHSVSVVRTEDVRLQHVPAHKFDAPLLSWTDTEEVSSILHAADLVVHQIGNSYDFHMGNIEWLPRSMSVVCLHDFYLGHLFHGWACVHLEEAKGELVRWYGADSADAFFRHANSVQFIELTRDTMPATEWVAAMATGVMTHSSWGVERILAACAGPVWTVPLAYDVPQRLEKGRVAPRDASSVVNLLTVGHINSNKRVESVIRAISKSPVLKERICYRLVGCIEAATVERLAALASSLSVSLLISGEVDEYVLAEAFDEANIVCCLRWPSLEAASASAIEAMLHGKPVLVTDTGFYSEIPDECVIKISHDFEIDQLCQNLEALCANVEFAQSLGVRAQAWAARTFTASSYASRIEEIADVIPRAGAVNQVAAYFSSVLGSWRGASMRGALDVDALKLFNEI